MGHDHSETLIHEIFRAQSEKDPEGTALRYGNETITYSALEARAAQLAVGLVARGIGSGSTVGLHMDRSIDWVVGILGVLKTNAAVVPLPASNPEGWLRDILAFSSLDLVVDQGQGVPDPRPPTDVVSFSGLLAEVGFTFEKPASEIETGDPQQPAFVLCSSGSTGRPKMIVRSHDSFFHRFRWTWGEHPFGPGEVCCQKAHMTTTHSVYELLEPLLVGVPVVIIPDEAVRNLEVFWRLIRENGVTRLLIVPSALRASLDVPGFSAPPMNVLVIMGEYLNTRLAERTLKAFPEDTKVFSIYGSTEASSTLVCDVRKYLRPSEELPLGVPISSDVRPLVLDRDSATVEPGGEGRLFMAGTALFQEYFKDPEMTEEAFSEFPDVPSPVYDTKDQVRLSTSGEIQYVGRVDDTVKIRGFRVDLPEVERGLLLHPDVGQAIALATDQLGEGTSLIGFYTPNTIHRSEVAATLRQHLPSYMVPSFLVGLESFPLTASAKVDRIKLLERFAQRADVPVSDSGLTTTEEKVMAVWKGTLGHSQFGATDNFFEVGGDSLSVFTLAHSICDGFGITPDQMPEQSIYNAPTVSEMAVRVEGILSGDVPVGNTDSPIRVTLRKGLAPDKSPLFLIASAGGTLGVYQKLAGALTTDREVIGIRDPFVWGQRDPTEGFQRWVGLYLDAIRERQPSGPYFIGAYSAGGAWGLEIARQLQEQGQEVPLLALIDPLALDRRNKWRYGHWALQATWMGPVFREIVKLVGRLRAPFLRLVGAIRTSPGPNNHTFSDQMVEEITRYASTKKSHIRALAGLMELNTGVPYDLADDAFLGIPAEEYLGVLLARVAELTPEVDPSTVERIAVQYELQARSQHAYELRAYDGFVWLAQARTKYLGLLEAQLRPHLKHLETQVYDLGTPTVRTAAIVERFGSLEAHFRCMRDDQFVASLAKGLDRFLG